MTKIYKLETDSFKDKRIALVKRGIIMAIFCVTIGFGISFMRNGFNLTVLIMIVPIVAIAIYFGLKRGIKIQEQAWSSFTIEWNGNELTKSQIRTKDVLVHRDEIVDIEVTANGVSVKTADKNKSVFIPKELKGLDELLNILRETNERYPAL